MVNICRSVCYNERINQVKLERTMNMSDMCKEIFSLLNAWANYPNYQLERRADIFFALYLPEIMKAECIGERELEHTYIFPEFPLMAGDPPKTRKPKCVDYAVFGKEVLYLIELKTTMDYIKNIKSEDIKYLTLAQKTIKQNEGMQKLIGNIEDMMKHSTQRNKYEDLLARFNDTEISKRTNRYKEIRIIYILPIDPNNEGFKHKKAHIHNTFKDNRITPVSFEKVMDELPVSHDMLARNFKDSLNEWKTIEENKNMKNPRKKAEVKK